MGRVVNLYVVAGRVGLGPKSAGRAGLGQRKWPTVLCNEV